MQWTDECALGNATQSSTLSVVYSLRAGELCAANSFNTLRTGQTARELVPGGKLYSQPIENEVMIRKMPGTYREVCRLHCKSNSADA